MRIRKYCVTVMDNWHPSRYFFMLWRAKKYTLKHSGYAYLWEWDGKRFVLYDFKVRL